MEAIQEEKKKLPVNDAIIMMAQAINNNDTATFYKTVERFASNFDKDGNTRWRIMNAIKNRPMQLKQLDSLGADIKKLLIAGEGSDTNVFLNDSIKELIDGLALEWLHIPEFHYHNLNVRNKILLHGVTGNGKTTIAKYIAKKAALPFIEVKFEEVVDSHLGSTGKNIWNIFNKVIEPCVLFWDEVDTVGFKRGTGQQSGASQENDRMTNSLLVNMEKMRDDVIFIAATNRLEVLDSAFLRRFDVKFEVLAPSEKEKQHFAQQLIEYYKLPDISVDLQSLSSYAEIKNKFVAMARDYVIEIIKNKNQ